jgi:hypothetical protein
LKPPKRQPRSDTAVHAERHSSTLLRVSANTADQIRSKNAESMRVNEIACEARHPASAFPAHNGAVKANIQVSPRSSEFERCQPDRTDASTGPGGSTQPNTEGERSFRCVLLLGTSTQAAEQCRSGDRGCEFSSSKKE